MGVKTRRIFVMIAITIISLFWIKGNGSALLLRIFLTDGKRNNIPNQNKRQAINKNG